MIFLLGVYIVKTKITIIIGAFLPVPAVLGGAVEKLWYRLAKELNSEHIEVTLISKKHQNFADLEEVDGMLIKRVKGYTSTNFIPWRLCLDFMYSIRAVWSARKSDITITNTFWSPVLAKLFTKSKVWVSVHRYPKHQMFLYKYADAIQPVSHSVKQAILKQYPALSSKTQVIPNYVKRPKLAIKMNDKKKQMLFVGRLHPEKGVGLLIRAFVSAELQGWQLVIIGPHEIEAGGGGVEYLLELQRLAEGNSQIRFIGAIYDEDNLNRYYRESAVFTYPSLAEKGEAFGLAPLEAMSYGCQVIVSKLTCFNDFCTTENSIRVDLGAGYELLGEALSTAAMAYQTDKHLMMLNNSIKTAEMYNLTSIGDQMRNLILRLNETPTK
jgi:glycosyltransferase involved in cell wall biosynthesis